MKKFAILALSLALAGCAGLCQNKDKLMDVFAQTQASYDQYVKQSKTGDQNIILADQILAIAGPWAAGSLAAACPPDGVIQELQEKEAEIKK